MKQLFVSLSFLLIFLLKNGINSVQLDMIKLIEMNIDDEIDPCEDFYRHACKKDQSDHSTFVNIIEKSFRNEMDELMKSDKHPIFPKIVELENFVKLLDPKLINDTDSARFEYMEKCINNKEEARQMLLDFNKLIYNHDESDCCFTNLIFDTDCERAADNLIKRLKKKFNDVAKKGKKSWNNFLKFSGNFKAFLWTKANNDLILRSRELFENLREDLMELIEETPWLINSNTVEAMTEIANQLKVVDTEMITEFNQKEVNDALDSIEKCTFLTSGTAKKYCYATIEVPRCEVNWNRVNAMNFHPYLSLTNPVLSILSLNLTPAMEYGLVVSILGHEYGHTLMRSKKDHILVPYFSENVTTCVQNQFTRSCSFFKEGLCETEIMQFDENGADLFGGHLTYEAFKKRHSCVLNKSIRGYEYCWTPAKLFFYSMAAVDCYRENSESNPDDPHHASKIRVNAVFAQIPDFAEVFQCDAKSKMMQSRSEQCHLFGSKAPEFF